LTTEKNILIGVAMVWGTWLILPLTCLFVARWWSARKLKKESLAGLTTVGNESTPTYMDYNQREVHSLFHTLWSKAVGTENYNKSEWKQLGNYLYSLMEIPGASQKIAGAEREVKPPTRFQRDEVV
jgi:hypothetical protein